MVHHPLGPYGAEELTAIKNKAAERPMRVVEVAPRGLHPRPCWRGKGAPFPASTMAVLHEHSLGPTGKQKVYLPLVVLGILAVCGRDRRGSRDHVSKS